MFGPLDPPQTPTSPSRWNQVAAVSNHAVQAEELSVVVVQVVQFVLHFVEKLWALSEANLIAGICEKKT